MLQRRSVGAGFTGTLWRANPAVRQGLLAGGEPAPVSGRWPEAQRRVRAWGASPSRDRADFTGALQGCLKVRSAALVGQAPLVVPHESSLETVLGARRSHR